MVRTVAALAVVVVGLTVVVVGLAVVVVGLAVVVVDGALVVVELAVVVVSESARVVVFPERLVDDTELGTVVASATAVELVFEVPVESLEDSSSPQAPSTSATASITRAMPQSQALERDFIEGRMALLVHVLVALLHMV